jgi:hypothetical protein
MNAKSRIASLCSLSCILIWTLGGPALSAATLTCDLAQYRPIPGLAAEVGADDLTVQWDGESGQKLRARFGIRDGVPTVRELAIQTPGGNWNVLARELTPEFGVTTGIRRTNHGLPEENRWDVFWDTPLNRPGDVRRFSSSFHADRCAVRTDGVRLEISFPGLEIGIFAGSLQFTVYRGTNLLRMEAIAKTEEPSVAYKYDAGLKGLSAELLPRVVWRDVKSEPQMARASSGEAGNQVVLRARNRLAIAEGSGGSIAVFPPPHQFFFARELEVNLGYVWYRKDGDATYSLGVRHAEKEEGYNPAWINGVFALYNAPPGTWQRMSGYFYLSSGDAGACRESVMAYTRGDRYKPLPGYKTMVTHFHFAFTKELIDSGSLDATPPWIPMFRDMGINIAHIFDFHGDGHPNDPGPLRLPELESYFMACLRHSDENFLILPGEEANAHLGGHYNILFPRPVYWTHVRAKDQPLVEQHPKYGTVYHTGSAADVFEMMKLENALVWQTHPRTKGSTGYPDKIKETDYLKSDQWLGTAFKALPVDLSQKRLGEIRCFGTLDDMNNWGRPKYMVGEVDTYKKFPDYDLYGDFNVNYVKLDRVPGFEDWTPINRALRTGDFFVTTGEALIRNWSVEGQGAKREVVADVEWTFPLEFVEAVWGDGQKIGREVISATDQPPFGGRRFRIPFDATGKKWVRFSIWDSAGNGAFTQPVHLQ